MTAILETAAPTCDCPADGFCERYQREMAGRLREICQGINISPDKAEAYRRNWAAMLAQPQTTCAHFGEPTGNLVKCEKGCKSKLKTFACAVYGECTPQTKGEGVNCCNGCPDFRPPVAVDCDTHGFGDAVLMAWIAEGSKGSMNRIVLKAHGEKADLLKLLGQTVVSGGETINQQSMVDAEERIHYSESRIHFRAKFLGMLSPPKRPAISLSPEIMDWGRQVAGGIVLLAPQSNHRSREWTIDGWTDLAERLTAAHVPFLFVGSQPRPDFERFPGIYNLPIARVCSLVLHARHVVCVDSFIANLGGAVNTPTTCLLSFTTPFCFDHTPSVRCLQGTSRRGVRNLTATQVIQELSHVGLSIPATQ